MEGSKLTDCPFKMIWRATDKLQPKDEWRLCYPKGTPVDYNHGPVHASALAKSRRPVRYRLARFVEDLRASNVAAKSISAAFKKSGLRLNGHAGVTPTARDLYNEIARQRLKKLAG